MALPGVRSIWRALISAYARVVYSRRQAALCIERWGGITLVVLPHVFDGILLRSGKFLAQSLSADLIVREARVLDVGTGSGLNAIRAAQLGAQVVAVDINPESVRCAQINALINHVEDRVQVRLGDLFAPARDGRFDVILFNPPFFQGMPRGWLDQAWRGTDVFERFLAGLDEVLAPRGSALVILSSDGDLLPALQSMETRGWRIAVVAAQDLINEVLTVYHIERAEDVGQP